MEEFTDKLDISIRETYFFKRMQIVTFSQNSSTICIQDYNKLWVPWYVNIYSYMYSMHNT